MKRPVKSAPAGYAAFLENVTCLLEDARRASARAVNSVITTTYWEIGRRIFEHEQKGKARADYGELLLDRLSADLSKRFGRGFSRSNIFQMRQFYLAYREKIQTVSGQSDKAPIVHTPSGQLETSGFPLSWSHYSRLLSVSDPAARVLRGGGASRRMVRPSA